MCIAGASAEGARQLEEARRLCVCSAASFPLPLRKYKLKTLEGSLETNILRKGHLTDSRSDLNHVRLYLQAKD